MKSHWAAGNVKMKGKKYYLFTCRCCQCEDFRDKVKEQEKNKEIREFKEGKDSIAA